MLTKQNHFEHKINIRNETLLIWNYHIISGQYQSVR